MSRLSQVISMRLPPQSGDRLRRLARRLNRSASELSAILVEEGLRRDQFSFIDFRRTPTGRQAYLQNSRLAVWMVAKLLRDSGGNIEQTAAALGRSPLQIAAAHNYAVAYPDEIEDRIGEHQSWDFAQLSRQLPQAQAIDVPRSHTKAPSATHAKAAAR